MPNTKAKSNYCNIRDALFTAFDLIESDTTIRTDLRIHITILETRYIKYGSIILELSDMITEAVYQNDLGAANG